MLSALLSVIYIQSGRIQIIDNIDISDADTTAEGWKDKTGKFNFMTEEQLKTKFASLPDDGPKGLNSNEPYNPDLSQYKSMEELKRDFEALNAQIQTESEIVTDLVSDLKTFDHSSDILLTKLEDLSFYMHQIDNAQDFVLKMDGLDLIRTFLNHTHSQVRQSALKVLTACLQANQRLKVFAIENGQVLNLLTQTLTSEQNSEDAIVAKSALYSLSALLRNFPFAQKLFADINGFDLLCRLVHKGVLPSTKVLQLKTDLIMEARTCLDQKDDTDLMKQYQLTAIWNKVGCACDMITSDLETAQQNINSLAKIDSLLDAVRFLRMSCPPEEQRIWSSVGGILLKVLQEDFKLKMENMGQSGDNESLEYQGEIIEKLSQVLLSLEKTFPERDEL